MKRVFQLLPWILAGAAATAAPLSRDLGDQLIYHRIHTLPADLPTAAANRPPAYVIDLRYVASDAAGATALHGWIRFHATPRTPVFVLANLATAPVLLQSLAARGAGPHVIVLGAAGEGFAPDIAIAVSPENERLAYDALETGADLATLLQENPDKVRNDEARLAHDHFPESVENSPAHASRSGSPAPPLDAALQRAVHLHRALRALKKI